MTAQKRLIQSHIGISITQQLIEAVVFNPKTLQAVTTYEQPMPHGLLKSGSNEISDPSLLSEVLNQVTASLNQPRPVVHLSIPATLLRLIEMPRLKPQEMSVFLSSEAERYKAFDNTEAIVDFCEVQAGDIPLANNMQRVMFGAIRKDTLLHYFKACKKAKLKLASIDFEPLNVLRGMAGSGVLDSLVEQIGPQGYWGTLFVEPERMRICIWQGDSLYELREVYMDTDEFLTVDANSVIVGDLLDEIHRTLRNSRPAIWFTHQMPPTLELILTDHLGTPVRPCFTGPALQVSNVLPHSPAPMVSSLGIAMRSAVPYPFDFDLARISIRDTGGTNAGPVTTSAQLDYEPDSATPGLAIAGGVLSLLLMLALWAGLFFYNQTQLVSKITDLEAKKQTALAQIQSLSSKLDILRSQWAIQANVLGIVRDSRIKNAVYYNLAQDLKDKTPDKVWLHNIQAGTTLTLEGKALNDKAVLEFAKSFDGTPYISSVLISTIKESFIGSTPVFEFKLDGKVNLTPLLLEGGKTVPPQAKGL